MKIVIVTDTYKPEINGVVTSIEKFSKRLAQRGHQVYIFCPRYSGEKSKKEKNIHIKRFYSVSFINNKEVRMAAPALFSLIKEFKKIKPNVVHIQTPMVLGVTSLFAVRILKLKSIQTYHSYIPEMAVYLKPKSLPGLSRLSSDNQRLKVMKRLLSSEITFEEEGKFKKIKLEKGAPSKKSIFEGFDQKITNKFSWNFTRAVYNRSEQLITPSYALKRELQKNGITPPIEVVSNGIDADQFKKKIDFEPKYRLIHLGRLGHEKNVDVVIKAFSVAQKDNPKLRLDIVGDGPARPKLEKLVKERGLEDRVRFLGFIEREKCKKIFPPYDAFLTASIMETQGLAILEAMSAKLPIIAVDKLAVNEIVKNGKNGYLSKPGKVMEMVGSIERFYKNESNIKKFGEASHKIAKSHDTEKSVEKLLKIYKKNMNKEKLPPVT